MGNYFVSGTENDVSDISNVNLTQSLLVKYADIFKLIGKHAKNTRQLDINSMISCGPEKMSEILSKNPDLIKKTTDITTLMDLIEHDELFDSEEIKNIFLQFCDLLKSYYITVEILENKSLMESSGQEDPSKHTENV